VYNLSTKHAGRASTRRYAYPDHVFGRVLHLALSEGVSRVGIHYDIMCHYIVNMWERFSHLQAPIGAISQAEFESFVTAIPKFHLAGHNDSCFVRFSLNLLAGVGRLDAEGNERTWANLNHCAPSTMEKGPGSHVDTINYVMDQWNWCKQVEIGTS
jgi:hypothetical protein